MMVDHKLIIIFVLNHRIIPITAHETFLQWDFLKAPGADDHKYFQNNTNPYVI